MRACQVGLEVGDELDVQVGVELDVEVGVWATPTSSFALCIKAFPKEIQVDVGRFAKYSLERHPQRR